MAKNYIINEANDEPGEDTMNKKPPLEVLKFPEPPREKPPRIEHYSVEKENGEFEVYAQPITKKCNDDITPKKPKPPAIPKRTLSLVNYNPFDHNYSILSPSR